MRPMRSLVWTIGLVVWLACVCPQLHAAEEIVELNLQTVKALRGVVLYPNGEVVNGAKVAELTQDWKTELRATTTDSQGHFLLAPVKGRNVYYLQVTVPGAAGVNILQVPVKISRFWGKPSLRLLLHLA